MIVLELITAQNAAVFRTVRLNALRDAPNAFGSTHAKESELTDADWTARIIRWNGEKGIGFLAMDGSAPCGMAGSFLDHKDQTRAHLVSMWTAPSHRRRGIGRLLVDCVVGWAHQRGARVLQLMVTSNNERAISFYHSLGFTRTGRTEPYPNDATLTEYEMGRLIP